MNPDHSFGSKLLLKISLVVSLYNIKLLLALCQVFYKSFYQISSSLRDNTFNWFLKSNYYESTQIGILHSAVGDVSAKLECSSGKITAGLEKTRIKQEFLLKNRNNFLENNNKDVYNESTGSKTTA